MWCPPATGLYGTFAGMARFTARELRKVHEIEGELGCYRQDAPRGLPSIAEPLHEIFGAELTFGYALAPREDSRGVRLDSLWGAGLPEHRVADIARIFDAFLRGHDLDWGAYNPLRPEVAQRNRVLDLREMLAFLGRDDSPVMRELFPRMGLEIRDQPRALICDGPSFLAFVGGFQPEPAAPRQKRILGRLLPAFRRRLLLERAIDGHARLEAALDVAMEAVGGAAFLVDATGRIAHANSAAQAALKVDRQGTLASLGASIGGRSVPGLRVTRIRTRGGADQFLVIVEPPAGGGLEERVAAAATRWGLTPRQAEILMWIVRGKSNPTVAALFGIAERTVEAHVTAILLKADVESRSALVSLVLTER
jgi:DNA-binding CsgD family transcriptional regulator